MREEGDERSPQESEMGERRGEIRLLPRSGEGGERDGGIHGEDSVSPVGGNVERVAGGELDGDGFGGRTGEVGWRHGVVAHRFWVSSQSSRS